MSTGTYPTIGIARMGHSGDIRDCRCGFVRMGFIDWDLLNVFSNPKTEQYSEKTNPYSDKSGIYSEKSSQYSKKTGNYVNSPNKLE